MKVKIGNKIYDSNVEPIMIIFSPGEREQIKNMAADATKYCIYPDEPKWVDNDFKGIKEWMFIQDKE